MIGMLRKLVMNVDVYDRHVPQIIDECNCYMMGMFHKLFMNVGVI